MAFYCELTDVIGTGVSEQNLIDMTNDGEATAVDQDVFDACRVSATSMIDSFAAVLYSEEIPFTPVPPSLVTIAAQLTKYFLYSRNDAVSEAMETVYEQQMSILKLLAAGKFRITGVSGNKVKKDTILFSKKSPGDRAFAPGKMGGY